MLYLWIFGNNVEDRLGRVGFLALLPRGRACWPACPRSPSTRPRTIPTIGASGAIAAILGAYIDVLPAGAGHVARLPRLLLPADRRPGDPRARLLVRPPAHRRDRLDRTVEPVAASRSSPISAGSWPGPWPLAWSSWSASVATPPSRRRRRRAPRRHRRPSHRPWDNPAMDDGLVEMVVESVRVHMLSSRHVVILKETLRDRYLPIWIGPWEASAIAMKLQGLTPERPLTHDLFVATLEELGVRVERVVICDLADETFHARIIVDGPVRPSRSTPGRPMPSPWRSGPVSRSSRRAAVLEQAALGGDGGLGEGRRASSARPSRRPANGSSTRGSTSSATSSTRSTWTRKARAGAARVAEARPLPAEDRPAAPQGARPVDPHLQSQPPEVADRPGHDLRLRTGRRASRARVVRHPDLDDRPTRGAQLDEQLGREEGAVRFDRDALERGPPEELAGAVDVADREPEEDPVGEPVRPGVQDPDRWVRALDPEADDDIGCVGFRRPCGQPADVGDLELAVAVGERDELVTRRSEAGAEGRAVAEVGRVVDDPDDVRDGEPPARRRWPASGPSSRRRQR